MSDAKATESARVRFSVVIPAHNEEHRIGETLTALAALLDRSGCSEVIVVDDGSTDQTLMVVEGFGAQRASSIPVRTIRVDGGHGKGAAIRTGVASARSAVVVLVDADLPVSPDALVVLATRASSTDLVLGSRRIDGSSFEMPQPFARRLGGLLFRTCARSLGFRGGSDPQCGAKALRVERVGPIVAQCVSDNFALDAELIERCRRADCSIVEVPVRWCHRPGSTVRPIRDFVRTVRSLGRARASVIASGDGARSASSSASPADGDRSSPATAASTVDRTRGAQAG